MLDITKPLVHLLHQEKAGKVDAKSVTEATQAALKLAATASYDIVKRRRRNIWGETDPRSEYLLDDPKAFSSKETRKHLFGQRFLDSMVKEADQDAKLSRRSPPGRASAETGPSTRSKTKRGGASSGRGRGNRGGRRYISSFLVVPPTELYLPPLNLTLRRLGVG